MFKSFMFITFLLVSSGLFVALDTEADILGTGVDEGKIKQDSPVEYPDGYEDMFSNYLSLDRTQEDAQIIRLFANDTAMQGKDEQGRLPYGSVLVAEVYKAKKDENGEVMVSSLGRRIRGKLALIAVMERREGFGRDLPDDLRNGEWDFGAFKPDGSDAGKDLNDCRACHAPLVETNFLFSLEHLTGN